MYKIFFCLTVFIVISFETKCQAPLNGQNIIPQSPNTTSMGIFGEVPVSNFTGIPDISIPLYNVDIPSHVEMPLSLTYHALGIRTEEHAPWVGIGWNLNIGGVITRNVKGRPDECTYDVSNPISIDNHYQTLYNGKVGFFFNYNLLGNTAKSDWSTTFDYPKKFNSSNYPFDQVDYEPDIFNFNFLGYSGKFFINYHTGKFVVQCDKALRVEFDNNDWVSPFLTRITSSGKLTKNCKYIFKTFKKFTIIDESGNKYIFGSSASGDFDHAIEYSMPLNISQTTGTGNLWSNIDQEFTPISWYLTKVILANGNEEINLNYERGPFIPQLNYASNSKSDSWDLGIFAHCSSSTCSPPSLEVNASYTSPVYLKEVEFPKRDLKISFTKSVANDLKYDYDQMEAATITYTNCLPIPFTNNHDVSGQLISDLYNSNLTDENNDYLIPEYQNMAASVFNSNDPQLFDYRSFYPNAFVWFKLNNISITNLQGDIKLRTIKFNYREDSKYRLRLSDLEILDSKNSNPIQQYSFNYNNELLPEFLTAIGDHWGYYNGNQYASTDPTYSNQSNHRTYFYYNYNHILDNTSTSLRNPNLTYAKAEMLEKIVYPTGGSTSFDYELNDYSSYVDIKDRLKLQNISGTGGGLRIKTITNDDGFGNTFTKNYIYKKNYQTICDVNQSKLNASSVELNSNVDQLESSGILNVFPVYKYDYPFNDKTNNTFISITSLNPIAPLTLNSAGTFVGYSEVVEKLSDGSFTIYKYTNHSNNDVDGNNDKGILLTDNNLLLTASFNSNSHFRGKLISSSSYNSSCKCVHEKKYDYVNVRGNDANVELCRGFYSSSINIHCDALGEHNLIYPTLYWYQLEDNVKLPQQEYEDLYDINDPQNIKKIETVKSYTYSAKYKQLTKVVTKTSDGKTRTTNLTYPTDKSTTSPYSDMNSANMIGTPITKEVTTTNSAGTTLSYEKQSTNYIDWKGYNSDDGSTITNHIYAPQTVEEQKGSNASEVKVRYHGYDNSGNIITVSKENDMKLSYIWDYNHTHPIAEIKNANNTENSSNIETARDHAYTSFESDGTGNWKIPSYIDDDGFTIYYGLVSPSSNGIPVGITGNNAYNLGLTSASPISNSSLNATINYVLTYWSTNTTAATITPTGTNSTVTPSSAPLISKTINGTQWYLYSAQIAKATGISITGSVTLDELRLYPTNAQMTTYTYDPHCGMTSQCDVNNKITYYKYDNFQRLQSISDQDGNILKTYNYQYKKSH